MSEIEKMYENCGIEIPIARLKTFKDDNGEIFTQPPFTAEKQIELYCFILSQDKYVMTFEATLPLTPGAFAEGVAEATNHIWQSLSEEEKQQVKGILE